MASRARPCHRLHLALTEPGEQWDARQNVHALGDRHLGALRSCARARVGDGLLDRPFAGKAHCTFNDNGRSQSFGCGRSSRQLPEVVRKSEAREDRLVLVTEVWLPVGVESIAPPCVGQLAQLGGAERGAWFPTVEPSHHMLLRPEEVHRASGEDDVVPPGGCRNEAVEEQAFVAWSRRAYLALDGLIAVSAHSLDAAVDVQCGADAKRVPRTVRIPRSAVRMNAIRRRHGGERIGHPQFGCARVQNDGVRVVQPPPRGADLIGGSPGGRRDVGVCGRASPIDKQVVRPVPNRDVAFIHRDDRTVLIDG